MAQGTTDSDVFIDAFVDGFTIGTVAADVAYLEYCGIAEIAGKLKAGSKLGSMAEREAAGEPEEVMAAAQSGPPHCVEHGPEKALGGPGLPVRRKTSNLSAQTS
jgi:hypothetical protein